MRGAESFRVLLFVGAVGTVYRHAALVLFRWAVRRRLHRGAPPTRRQALFHRGIHALAGLGLLCIAYVFWIEPTWVGVPWSRIPSPKLSRGNLPVWIVHLSNLHCDLEPRLEERLPGLVAAQKPDLIVFSGDAVNSPAGVPILKACLTRLSGIAPTSVYFASVWKLDGRTSEQC